MDALNEVAANIRAVSATLPDGVRLVAVSKFHPAEYIREAYDAGQRVFGESRDKKKMLFMIMVVAGVIGLRLCS